jgi:hypothetical protein
MWGLSESRAGGSEAVTLSLETTTATGSLDSALALLHARLAAPAPEPAALARAGAALVAAGDKQSATWRRLRTLQRSACAQQAGR